MLSTDHLKYDTISLTYHRSEEMLMNRAEWLVGGSAKAC